MMDNMYIYLLVVTCVCFYCPIVFGWCSKNESVSMCTPVHVAGSRLHLDLKEVPVNRTIMRCMCQLTVNIFPNSSYAFIMIKFTSTGINHSEFINITFDGGNRIDNGIVYPPMEEDRTFNIIYTRNSTYPKIPKGCMVISQFEGQSRLTLTCSALDHVSTTEVTERTEPTVPVSTTESWTVTGSTDVGTTQRSDGIECPDNTELSVVAVGGWLIVVVLVVIVTVLLYQRRRSQIQQNQQHVDPVDLVDMRETTANEPYTNLTIHGNAESATYEALDSDVTYDLAN